MQVRDVLPQLDAMRGMSFPIVRSVVQVSMFALKGFSGADQLLMLVFEALVHPETSINNTDRPAGDRAASPCFSRAEATG